MELPPAQHKIVQPAIVAMWDVWLAMAMEQMRLFSAHGAMHELAQYQDEGNDQWTPWPGLVWDTDQDNGDLGDRGDYYWYSS